MSGSFWHVLILDKSQTRQSKHCGFSIYIFDNSKSKSMVRLVRAEKMVLSGLVFARKIGWFWFRIYRVWWVPWWWTWHLCLYICEKCEMSRLWHTNTRTHEQWKVVQYSVWAESAILKPKFGQYFAANSWLRLWSWILVEILKILKLSLVGMLMLGWDFVDVLSRFWRWVLIKIYVWTFDMT